MKKTILTEEIERIFEIMNNEKGMLILESNLLIESILLEGPTIANILKSAEKFVDKNNTEFFDKEARDASEKFLDNEPLFTGKGKGRKSFEVRLSNFIDKYNNEPGFNKLEQYIKSVSSVSKPFAKHFAEQHKDIFAKWESKVKNDPKYKSKPDTFDRLVTMTFGEDVLKAYKEIPPTSSVGSRAGSSVGGRTDGPTLRMPTSPPPTRLAPPIIKSKSQMLEKEIEQLEKEFGLVSTLNPGIPKNNLNQIYLWTAGRFFVKYWKNVFTRNEILKKKIVEKMKQIQVKLSKSPPDSVEIDMEDLYLLFLGLRKSHNIQIHEMVLDRLVNSPSLRNDTKKLLQSSVFKSSFDALAISEAKNAYGPFKEDLRAFMQTFPVLNFIDDVIYKKMEDKSNFRKLFPDAKRVMNFIVWKDGRGIDEVIRQLTRRGARGTIISKILSWFTINTIIIPYLMASFKQIMRNVKHNYSRADYAISEELCKTLKELNPNNAKICDNLPKLSPKPTKEDFWKWYKGSLPFDVFGVQPYGKDLKGNLTKNAFFWTYLDEIGELVYDTFDFFKNGDINTENLKRLYQVLDGKTKQELTKLGWDLSKTNEENLEIIKAKIEKQKQDALNKAKTQGNKLLDKTKEKATEVVTDIVDSEAGFRAWCLKERKTPREVEPYNPDTHFAYTNDGKKWFYDNGTFNPKPE